MPLDNDWLMGDPIYLTEVSANCCARTSPFDFSLISVNLGILFS